MADVAELLTDLVAEGREVVALVAPLDVDGWATATPAPGWSVLDHVTHLARFDDMTTLAIADAHAFRAERDALVTLHGAAVVDAAVAAERHRRGQDALAWFQRARHSLVAAARDADPAVRVPWFGPDMSLASKLTARIMETWAHGQDVADALGVAPAPTTRLRHVAFIGARALPNSYLANGRPVPDAPVRVELAAPNGDTWTFGPDDAGDVVRGPALDFCLVVTRRRHPADTALVADGPVATEWLGIAQAFAGAPGAGRRPGQYPGSA